MASLEPREFVYAVFRRKTDQVKEMLQQGMDPDSTWSDGKTTGLCIAVDRLEDIEMTNLLLEAGANPNQICTDYQHGYEIGPPIIVAILNLNVDMVRFLLEKGVDPKTRDVTGNPAIFSTLLTKGKPGKTIKERLQTQLAILDLLLEAGADINAVNPDGLSLLMIAVKYSGKKEILFHLLSKGADPYHTTVEGETVLEMSRPDGTPYRSQATYNVLSRWIEGRGRQVRRALQGLPVGNNAAGIIANFAVGPMNETIPMPPALSRERLLTPAIQREAEANTARRKNTAVRKLQKAWRNKTKRNTPSSRRARRKN